MRQRGAILGTLFAILAALPLAASGGSGKAELRGAIQSRPAGLIGDWVVAAKTVHVSASTTVKQEIAPAVTGATVQVKGMMRGDGSLEAETMEVESAAPGAGGGPPAGETSFLGTLQGLPAGSGAGDWTVSGKTVHVTASTRINQNNGPLAIGATVQVEGTSRSDGSVDARSIEVRAPAPGGGGAPGLAEFRGAIEQFQAGAGDWRVGGRTVHVSGSTVLRNEGGAFAVGAFVEVKGTSRADGSIDATSIEVKFSPGAGARPAELSGAVEALPAAAGNVGDWTVAGKTIHVSAVTHLDRDEGTFALGSFVEVKGTLRSDGSVDASRIELVWGPETSGALLTSSFMIPSTAHRQGKNGAFFTTSLTFSNSRAAEVEVEIHFLGHDRDGREAEVRREHLGAGETRTMDDVLGTRFGKTDDFGALRVLANSESLIVSSHTSTPVTGGAFGQDVPAARREDLINAERERSIAGVRQDDRFRTNLVLSNATERALTVQVDLLGRDGQRIGGERIEMQPLEMKQLNDVARRLGAAGDLAEGRLVLSTPTPDGAFAAFASQIDNGTNDPRTLLPR